MRVEEEDELVLDALIVENLAGELMVKEDKNASLPIAVVDEERKVVSVDEIRDVIVIGDVAGEEDGHIVIDMVIRDECIGIGRELDGRRRRWGHVPGVREGRSRRRHR